MLTTAAAHLGWLAALPLLLGELVATWGPGLLVLLAAGARSRLAALACAPALTFALYGTGGVLLHMVGLRWSLPVVGAYVLAVCLLVAAGRWCVLAARGRVLTPATWLAQPLDPQGVPEPGSGGGAPGEPTRRVPATAGPAWLLVAGVLVTWAVMVSPVLPGTGPEVPIQSADSIYHYNQAWLIEHTGNASMLDGNAGMFGLDGHGSFYPMVFHQIVTLVSLGWVHVVPAVNTMLLVIPLVYLTGLVYLVSVMLPEIRGAAWIALGASALIPIFPMRLVMDTAVWPYTLALAACPAVAAWSVAVWRRCLWLWGKGRRARALVAAMALLPACLGLVATHPAAAVIVGWPLAVVAWTGLLLAAWRLWRRGERTGRVWAVVALVVAAAMVVAFVWLVVSPGPQQAHFGRRPLRTWDATWKKVVSALVLFYGGGGWSMKATFVTMAAVCLLGAWVCVKRRRHRGIVVAWVACLPLIIAAMAPIPVLSAFTGVFYNNPHRIKAMTAAPAVLLVTVGLAAAVAWAAERLPGWAGRLPGWAGRLPGWAGSLKDRWRPTPETRLLRKPVPGPGAAQNGPTPDGRLCPDVTVPPDSARAGSGQSEAAAREPGWSGHVRAWARRIAGALRGQQVALSIGAVVLVVATAATWPGVRADVRGAFEPSMWNQRYVASDDEKAMMRRLADELPADAVVIGDPVAGTAMLPFMAGIRPVWMFAGQADSDTDGWLLREHFKDLHTNPQICEVLRRHGIRYYYQDSSTFFNGTWLAQLRPGLYGVDTRTGFRLVDLGGSARVWEITACD